MGNSPLELKPCRCQEEDEYDADGDVFGNATVSWQNKKWLNDELFLWLDLCNPRLTPQFQAIPIRDYLINSCSVISALVWFWIRVGDWAGGTFSANQGLSEHLWPQRWMATEQPHLQGHFEHRWRVSCRGRGARQGMVLRSRRHWMSGTKTSWCACLSHLHSDGKHLLSRSRSDTFHEQGDVQAMAWKWLRHAWAKLLQFCRSTLPTFGWPSCSRLGDSFSSRGIQRKARCKSLGSCGWDYGPRETAPEVTLWHWSQWRDHGHKSEVLFPYRWIWRRGGGYDSPDGPKFPRQRFHWHGQPPCHGGACGGSLGFFTTWMGCTACESGHFNTAMSNSCILYHCVYCI